MYKNLTRMRMSRSKVKVIGDKKNEKVRHFVRESSSGARRQFYAGGKISACCLVSIRFRLSKIIRRAFDIAFPERKSRDHQREMLLSNASSRDVFQPLHVTLTSHTAACVITDQPLLDTWTQLMGGPWILGPPTQGSGGNSVIKHGTAVKCAMHFYADSTR